MAIRTTITDKKLFIHNEWKTMYAVYVMKVRYDCFNFDLYCTTFADMDYMTQMDNKEMYNSFTTTRECEILLQIANVSKQAYEMKKKLYDN